MSLWVHTTEQPMSPLTEQLVAHDLDDTRDLLDRAKQLPDEEYRATRLPGSSVLGCDGPDESIAEVLDAHRVHQGGLARRHRGRRTSRPSGPTTRPR